MKLKVDWLERKTSKAGKPYTTLTLLKDDGSKVDATMFSNFVNYANIKPGDTIEGELKANEYNGKTTYVLEMSSPSSFPRFTGGAKNEEIRAKNIEKAQDRKAESIAYFNSVNSAIAMYSALTKEEKDDLYSKAGPKEFLQMWRDWFLKEFDNWNNKPPF